MVNILYHAQTSTIYPIPFTFVYYLFHIIKMALVTVSNNDISEHTELIKDENSQEIQLNEVIEIPQLLPQETSSEQNIALEDGADLNCRICKKQCKSIIELELHYSTHKKAKRHICNVCNKEFTQKSSLTTHYLIHMGEKPHVCTVCNHRFTDKSTLRKHTLIHTGKKPFVCDICQKGFVQKITLKKHYLVHTGEKNNICEICNKRFAQKCTLLAHYHVHSKDTKYEKLRKRLHKNDKKRTVKVDATSDQKQELVQEGNQIVEPSSAYVRQFSNLISYYGTDQEKLEKIESKMNNNNSTPKLRHLLLGSDDQGDNIIQEVNLDELSLSSKNISPMTLDKNNSELPLYDNPIIKLEVDVESDIEEQANNLLDSSTNQEESHFLQLNDQSYENNSNGTGELYPASNKQSSSSSNEDLSVLKALQAVTDALRDANSKVSNADGNFGNYVGSMLASIPDSLNKETAKMKIMELLSNLKYGD